MRQKLAECPSYADDVKILEGIASQLEAASGAKPSVGQLVSVIVRNHLHALKSLRSRRPGADVPGQETAQPLSKTLLQQWIDEQIRPLREQVHRLEEELHGVSGRGA